MKWPWRMALCLVGCGWMICAHAAKITLAAPRGVPTSIMAADYTKFTAARDGLLGQMDDTQRLIDSQARDCESVEDGSSRIVDCKRRAVEVGLAVREYRSAVAQFNSRLAASLDFEQAKLRSQAALSIQALHPVEPIAIESHGEFRASLPDGRTLTVAETARLTHSGEVKLVTGIRSGAVLVLVDGTRITLAASTEVRTPDRAVAHPPPMLELIEGAFRWYRKADHLLAPSPSRSGVVRVKMVSIATRGTDFECKVLPDGSAQVKLHSGLIELTPVDGGDVVTLRPGEMVTLRAGKISRPSPIA